MTSISAASGSSYQTPLQKLQQELQAEIASGKVTSGDQDALSSALTDIDSSLSAGRASQSGGTKPSADDVKSRIDDLIDAQVASGKLTTDQATELPGVFQSAFSSNASGGAGGPRGAGGPPPGGGPGGPPPSDGASADGTEAADSSTDASDILTKFLASLKESLEASSTTSYSSSASTSSSKGSFSALLIDYST